MSNKRKFLFFSLIILSVSGLLCFSCKERQRDPKETFRERYEKLGKERDELLREQEEQQKIGPR
jgi:hypothetical protein